MWFGDLVTMRWWDDLWLNESFAEYLAHRCCTAVTPYPLWTEFGMVRKDWGWSPTSRRPPTRSPARPRTDTQTALQKFDGISYAKGAAVVKQLAAYLGEEVFVPGCGPTSTVRLRRTRRFGDLLAAWTEAGAVGAGALGGGLAADRRPGHDRRRLQRRSSHGQPDGRRRAGPAAGMRFAWSA